MSKVCGLLHTIFVDNVWIVLGTARLAHSKRQAYKVRTETEGLSDLGSSQGLR